MSRSDRSIAPHAHSNDSWWVKGVLMVHPPKPVLTQAQAIDEGLSDLLDVIDMASIALDGFDCEAASDLMVGWYETEVLRTPFTSESVRYDVQVAVRLDNDARAKVSRTNRAVENKGLRDRDVDPYTGLPYSHSLRNPGGFIGVTTRKVRR